MTHGLRDPFQVVADALGRPRDAISPDSAMYKDHGWDSFGHVRIIIALEAAYGIHIDDASIEKYTTMKAIQQLFEEISGGSRAG